MRPAVGWIAVMLAAAAAAGRGPARAVQPAGGGTGYRSHPPVRPLPGPSRLPAADGPERYADAKSGDDAAAGTRSAPWKTLAHAAARLRPGETLYLRGGTYFETAVVRASGSAGKPITIRSFPGELAVLDGGLREFQEDPAAAWEPHPAGSPGEFRSTRAYPEAAGPQVAVLGNFVDSMVPLHGYRNAVDLRSRNEYWNVPSKLDTTTGLYCGPGLWFDPETRRIHARLAPTTLRILGDANYRGAGDPRALPLVVAPRRSALRIEGARHLRLQDLVIRGSAGRTLEISGSEQIELDGLTVYGGQPALSLRSVAGLRAARCAFRGLSAPWSSRASHKYRSLSPYLMIAWGEAPQCRDLEFAHCEFTDNHDGLILGTARDVLFHHNLVENFDDDGIYLTLGRPAVPEGIRIYQNLLARTHTLFSFAQSDGGPRRNPIGPGVYIYRNVIDLRQGTYSQPPPDAASDAATRFEDHCRAGRPASDHGSPTWEPMFVYHNTVVTREPAFRSYYAAGWSSHTEGTVRRLFNNVFLQAEGMPGLVIGAGEDDAQADGNVHWGALEGPGFAGDFFAAFRRSRAFEASRKRYPAGWGASDRFADPKLRRYSPDVRVPIDARLEAGSGAIDAGVDVPRDWPDPLRGVDRGRPDAGALPAGAEPLHVGLRVGP